MHTTGVMSASHAAARPRSTNPVRGVGEAAASTRTRRSAFATITRSTGSVSSALRRSTVARGSIRTIRASVSGAPETSPTTPTRSPGTMGRRRSSLARTHSTVTGSGPSSSTTHVYRPRSTATTRATTASSWDGRCLVRGREPRLLARTLTSDSSHVLRATAQAPVPSRPAHSCGNSGSVLAVVAMFSTRIPGTRSPRMAPAVAMRWSW